MYYEFYMQYCILYTLMSQAKISYIENCKGVLSARDVAVLSRRLNVPITEFFRGLDSAEGASDRQQLVGQLVHYGAVLLAKPAGIVLKETPFEEVVNEALGFIEDERIYRGFCAALISHASRKEINIDRIFALIGGNAFLVLRLREVVRACLLVIRELNYEKKTVSPRAERQLRHIQATTNALVHLRHVGQPQATEGVKSIYTLPSTDQVGDLVSFVAESLNAKK
jgi:hypothetical protein